MTWKLVKRENLNTYSVISKHREFIRHVWSEGGIKSVAGQYRISSKTQTNRTAFSLLSNRDMVELEQCNNEY